MAEAEAGGRLYDSKATTLAGRGAMLATSGAIDGVGFSDDFRHDFLRK